MNDSLPPLDAELQRLLESERRRPAAAAEIKAQVAASLGATLGGRVPSEARARRSASPKLPWRRMAPALGAAFLLGAGLGAWLGPQRKPAPVERAVTSLVAPPSTSVAAGSSMSSVLFGVAPSASIAVAKAPARAAPTPSASHGGQSQPPEDTRLAAERALIDTARSALARGDAAAALDVLGRHRQQFPSGQLSEERAALVVQALASAGRLREAGESAGRFRLTYPKSLLLPVVNQAVGAQE